MKKKYNNIMLFIFDRFLYERKKTLEQQSLIKNSNGYCSQIELFEKNMLPQIKHTKRYANII